MIFYKEIDKSKVEPEICISNKFPGTVGPAGPGIKL